MRRVRSGSWTEPDDEPVPWPAAVSDDRLDFVLRRLSDNVASGSPIGSALCATCVEVLDLPGAGVMLRGDGVQQGVWSVSGPVMARIEDLEHTLGEGPCLDAFNSGVPVLEGDLADPGHRRWLTFAPAAVDAGARAAFGFPLGVGDARIGSLNLYADRPGPLADAQYADAMLLAVVATHVVLATQAQAPPDTLAAELADIGSHQVRVHQATGMVAAQLDVGVAEASAILRARAWASDRPISAVAADVVDRRLRFDS